MKKNSFCFSDYNDDDDDDDNDNNNNNNNNNNDDDDDDKKQESQTEAKKKRKATGEKVFDPLCSSSSAASVAIVKCSGQNVCLGHGRVDRELVEAGPL